MQGGRNTHRVWLGRSVAVLAAVGLAGCGPVFGRPNPNAGMVVLTWTPPTTTTSGTPLTQLAGYDIYGGFSPSALRLIAHIEAKWVARCTITGLSAGTWYFVVTSYTTDGTQSAPSNLVRKTIAGRRVFAGGGPKPLRWICRSPHGQRPNA